MGVCTSMSTRGPVNGSRRFYVRTYVPLRIRLLTTQGRAVRSNWAPELLYPEVKIKERKFERISLIH